MYCPLVNPSFGNSTLSRLESESVRPSTSTSVRLEVGDIPAALEEVPDLDHVALGILDVDRAVAAVVLLGSAHVGTVSLEALLEVVEAPGRGRVRVVHVGAALV